MDDDEGQQPYYSRSLAFNEGMAGKQEQDSSLLQAAQRYNDTVPKSYRPSGSLNGMAADQYQATLGGTFAVNNGAAQSTYETKKFFGKKEA